MSSVQFDVVVIGGGAAGLMAACAAAERGARVLLLEKSRKLGVKILMSGGSRCNITHACDARGIVDAFGKPGRFLHSALAVMSPDDVVSQMEGQGVLTKIESTGKVFPVSDRAIDVRDALVRMATDAGVRIQTESAVQAIRPQQATDGEGFEIAVQRPDGIESVTGRRVILTTGGKSYPGCGTTGDGYRWAQEMGHELVAPVPALVPILSRCDWANQLKGITVEDTGVEIWSNPPAAGDAATCKPRPRKRRPLVATSGSFLFTHWGLSGPSVLDASREVARHEQPRQLQLQCDFLPSLSDNRLADQLSRLRSDSGKQQVGTALARYFPRRFSDALLMEAGIAPETRNAEMGGERVQRLVDQIKRCSFAIQGTLGFEKAEVTAGGVALAGVDSRNLMSRSQPGLFLAGEILDLDGPIGGFNFQAAFSTGWLAGISAAS